MRVLAVLPFMMLSGAALAQEGLTAKVQTCAAITDNAARLACFDAAAASIKPAAVATFGLAKPSEAPKTIAMAVSKIETGPDGKLRFTLEDGQVWRQTDGVRLPGLGKGPWTAEVRSAAMGSFMLKLDNRTPVRVKRVS